MVNKTILVTGGAGFIGSNLCDALLQLGHTVVCLDNLDPFYSPSIKLQNILALQESTRFHFEQADITHPESLNFVFNKFPIDIVFHLASKVNVLQSFRQADEYNRVNIDGTKNLLNAMKAAGVNNLIFTSSSSVYGETQREQMREEDDLNPVNPYGSSKVLAEEAIRHHQSVNPINVLVLRLFNVYGRNIRPDLLVYRLFEASRTETPVTLYNKGENRKDFTYVDDVINAMILGLEFLRKSMSGLSTFNIGSGKCHGVIDVLKRAEDLLNKPLRANHADKIAGDVTYTRADISHAAEVLHWQPTTSLSVGLEHTFKDIAKRYG